jgi:hypothetical protein
MASFRCPSPASAFRTLVNCLDSIASSDLENPGLLDRVLRVSRSQGLIAPLLRGVAEDEGLLSASAAASYRHANGFVKIVLASSPLWALRLHLHNRDGTFAAAEHIHDHRWPFASTILRGTLVEERFRRQDKAGSGGALPSGDVNELKCDGRSSDFMQCIAFRCEPEDSHFKAEPVMSSAAEPVVVSLFRSATLRHEAGTTYHIDARELHAIVGKSEPSATLVLTGRPLFSSCALFSRPEVAPAERTAKQRLTEAEIREILLSESSLLELPS